MNRIPDFDFFHTGAGSARASRAYMDVLDERVQTFYREKVQKQWGGGYITRGRRPGAGAVLVNHNDYLGIGRDPSIARAICEAAHTSGTGLMMSAVFSGPDNSQRELEDTFAHFMQGERAVLCQSGYAANVGLLQSIASPGVPIYVDMLAHASIWEGVTSAAATPVPWRHNDLAHLERQIRKSGPGIITVDSVYSTAGDLCPLTGLVELAERTGCVLVVDESHSLGVYGADGSGLVKAMGLTQRVHFRTASLAKACVGRAGLIVAHERFADYFQSEARPAIFSSSLLPYDLAGLRASLELIRHAQPQRERLEALTQRVRAGLIALDYPVEATGSQIVPVEAGTEPQTLVLRDALEERGVFGAVFCAPATAANRAMVRASLNAALTDDEVSHLLAVFGEIRERVQMRTWRAFQSRLKERRAALAARHAVPVALQDMHDAVHGPVYDLVHDAGYALARDAGYGPVHAPAPVAAQTPVRATMPAGAVRRDAGVGEAALHGAGRHDAATHGTVHHGAVHHGAVHHGAAHRGAVHDRCCAPPGAQPGAQPGPCDAAPPVSGAMPVRTGGGLNGLFCRAHASRVGAGVAGAAARAPLSAAGSESSGRTAPGCQESVPR